MKLNKDIAAIVTGGASGMGAATSQALAERGVKVAIFDMNAKLGEPLAEEIGGVFCSVDIGSDESLDAAFARARAAHGQERILINCAGMGHGEKIASRDPETGEIKHADLAFFRKMLQSNLVGPYCAAAKSAAGMLTLDPLEEGERGIIINTSSAAAMDDVEGSTGYSAAKAGLLGLTHTMARDLGDEGIRSNTIIPGMFDTPLFRTSPPEMIAIFNESVPFPKRAGRTTEYASLVLEMISNVYLNGQNIRLDGALRLKPIKLP